MDIGRSTIFFGVVLIIGLKNNFIDCLIDLTRYSTGPMKYEMELFLEYNRIYNRCQEDLTDVDAKNKYDVIYKKEIYEPVLNKKNGMDKITEYVKMELTCIRKTDDDIDKEGPAKSLAVMWVIQFLANDYSLVFLQGYNVYKENNPVLAGKFLRIAVYLAAFGADLSTGNLLYNGIKYYIRRITYKYPDSNPPITLPEYIPYNDFVTKIQDILFSYYNPTENTLEIESSELDKSFKDLERISQLLNSFLSDALFARNPDDIGFKMESAYNNEELWKSALDASNISWGRSLLRRRSEYDPESLWAFVWKIEQSLSESINTNSVPEDALSGSSQVVELLRKIEILKLRLDELQGPPDHMKRTPDAIDKLIKGFDKGTLNALGIELVKDHPFLIFTRHYGGSSHYVAPETPLGEFKWHELIKH